MVELEPLINGREYGWADIVATIGGVPVTGITAIKYGEEMEKENIYGAGRNPVSRGYGRGKSTASITLLSGTVFALKSKAPKGQLHRIAPFPITVSYQPDAGPMVVHVLKNCEFKKTEFDWKEGDMSKPIELELIISHIVDKSK
nr:MAG TPA: putative XkdM-like protein [Caudoviricetes sp.]